MCARAPRRPAKGDIVDDAPEIRRVAFELARLSEELADTANTVPRETRNNVATVAARLAVLAANLVCTGTVQREQW